MNTEYFLTTKRQEAFVISAAKPIAPRLRALSFKLSCDLDQVQQLLTFCSCQFMFERLNVPKTIHLQSNPSWKPPANWTTKQPGYSLDNVCISFAWFTTSSQVWRASWVNPLYSIGPVSKIKVPGKTLYEDEGILEQVVERRCNSVGERYTF